MNAPEDFYHVNWDTPQECRKCGNLKRVGVFNPKTNEFFCIDESVIVQLPVLVSDLMETAQPWN